MSFFDQESLIEWFKLEKRSLPWRDNPSPYRVWVSEVMLQQTQVSVVIAYFERWMQLFPTIEALAKASFEEVIKAWEGLGYYSRVRYLYEGAKWIYERHNGQLPSTRADLEKIKGLGPYTIGAILSFAYHQKAAAVDGNVLRVMARYFLIEEDLKNVKTRQKITHLTERSLPDVEPWIVMEALIELGATVCQKKPKCALCPLQESCLAKSNAMEKILPIKSQKTTTQELFRDVAVVFFANEILIRRGSKGKVMADLYEFPYFERGGREKFEEKLKLFLGESVEFQSKLEAVSHSFTRYRAQLFPSVWKAFQKRKIADYEWVPLNEAIKLPFSSGHRRILKSLTTGNK